MLNIYNNKNSYYLQNTKTWHAEDSYWKAKQIIKIIEKNNIKLKEIVEVGCGVGEILYQLNELFDKKNIKFRGYDIAEDAINIANKKNKSNVNFFLKDFTLEENIKFDLLLMIDVFEHVPDYINFIENCGKKAKYKIFHVPLDIHLRSIFGDQLISNRESVGHIHYFTKETALATIEDSGLDIIDFFYTKSSDLSNNLKTRIANIPRKILFPFFPDFTVKLLGGYSLLVLAK